MGSWFLLLNFPKVFEMQTAKEKGHTTGERNTEEHNENSIWKAFQVVFKYVPPIGEISSKG